MNEMRERLFRSTNASELPFRARGEHHTRLEAFCDAVLAFAITLSVLSLEVPHDSKELLNMFRGMLSFGVTFTILFWIWSMQNRWCRRFGLDDQRTHWTMAGILFVELVFTYPLKFMMGSFLDPLLGAHTMQMHDEDLSSVYALYSGGFSALSGLFWSLYRRAWDLRDVLELDEAERFDTQQQLWTFRVQAIFGVVMAALLMVIEIPRTLPRPLRMTLLLSALAGVLAASAYLLLGVYRVKRDKKAFLAKWHARHAQGEPS
jgi:hypothetical protein